MSAHEEEDFATLFAASEAQAAKTERRARTGDTVRGRVIAVGADTAFVAIGAKSEAAINLAEFRDPESGEVRIAVGDQIEATVTDDGSRSGSIVLKKTLGRGGHVPGELEQALAHGIAVEGTVTGVNKGGFDVQIVGQRAFCPASQIDLRRREPAEYVGQRLQFRLTKIEGGGRNIVVSRRQLLEAEAAKLAETTWERLHVGATVQGTVTSLRDFGAFVDLGGVEGLVHVSELGYGRARHPSEVLKVGDTVEAKVVKIEPDAKTGQKRVGLSIRALAVDPWTTAAEKFPAGATVRGTVRKLEAFGAFVELAPGVDGLAHVSRIVADRRISHPKQALEVGAEVEVTVLSVEPEQRRMSLSMVEGVRRAQEAAEHAERQEETAALAKVNQSRGLGTFGELLKRSLDKQR
ncbi:MAG: S1 RNA-binding domain-containing protein [Deltaproteobacteria bacterium]|nr:S1 RNA-binding domain-containing protein [Deltaproteobacteria bacterium]